MRIPSEVNLSQSPLVLITGASSGLGLALSNLLIERTDFRLILSARETSLPNFGQQGIEESSRILLRRLDVTDENQCFEVIEEAERALGGVDILVNNAGVMYRSVVEHVTEVERLAQMDVNYRSAMELVRLVLPGMRKKRAGRILNISSVGGMMAMPTMAAYSASKFALEGATEALWYEVRPWNVKVSLIQPGFIRSDSFRNVRLTRLGEQSVQDSHIPYHAHYEHMAPFIERLMNLSSSTPESIARKILRTMRSRNPPLRVPATSDAHLFGLIRRLLPRILYHSLLYRMLPSIKSWGAESD